MKENILNNEAFNFIIFFYCSIIFIIISLLKHLQLWVYQLFNNKLTRHLHSEVIFFWRVIENDDYGNTVSSLFMGFIW